MAPKGAFLSLRRRGVGNEGDICEGGTGREVGRGCEWDVK